MIYHLQSFQLKNDGLEVPGEPAVHAAHALVAEGVLEAHGAHGGHGAHPQAVAVPLPGLAARAPRVTQHGGAALEVAADVEEHAPVEAVGHQRHGELGGSHDELAAGAHAALRVPPHAVHAPDGERLVGRQVPDHVAALGPHGELGAAHVEVALRPHQHAVEAEHVRPDGQRLLRGHHQLRLILAGALVHKSEQRVGHGVVAVAAEGERAAVGVLEALLLEVVVGGRALVRGAERAGAARRQRAAVLHPGHHPSHEDALGPALVRAPQLRVLPHRLRARVDGLQRGRVRVQKHAAGGAAGVTDPRVIVRHLDVHLGPLQVAAAAAAGHHLQPRRQRLAPPEQVAAVKVRVSDERRESTLRQALGGDAASAAEAAVGALHAVDGGVHPNAVHVAPGRPRDAGGLHPRRGHQVGQVVGDAAVERHAGLDGLEAAVDVRRLRAPLHRLPRLAIQEPDVHVGHARLLGADLQDAVHHVYAVPLHRHPLALVPLA
mmetsp:Transcript_5280/g.13461  ORF Transcript_5280/g.13461 Transcript_5280/m.13461 type:complete len:490 (-) Transcript_5280:594-2063(-)